MSVTEPVRPWEPRTERPQPVGDTTGPNPWWFHRQAQNDDERLQYAAATFAVDANLEALLVLRARHPDIFASTFKTTQAQATEYARRREAAIAIGKAGIPDPATYVAQIDALVDEAREMERPARIDGVMADHRAAFRALVAAGAPNGEINDEWGSWAADIAAETKYARARMSVRSRLSLGLQEPIYPPRLDWTAEYAGAMEALAAR